MPSVWKKKTKTNQHNPTSFGLFRTCCLFISKLQTFLTALAACPSLELLLPRIRKESFFANKPVPAPLPRKKVWLREKLLAQQISLLIDNEASVLPTQLKKRKKKKSLRVFNPLMLAHDTEESPLLLEVQLHLHTPHVAKKQSEVRGAGNAISVARR